MKHRIVIVIAIATACACHKEKGSSAVAPGAPASTAELDALWAKAPAGAVGGLVVSPRAITMTEHAWQDVHAFLKSFPAFAPAEQEMVAALASKQLTPDLKLADLGLAPGKGFAMFVGADGKQAVFLLPVVDRDKFLAITNGTKGTDTDTIEKMTCKMLDGWYTCTKAGLAFDTLGKGDLRSKLDAVKARGDIEGVAVKPFSAAGVVQIARGAITVRGMIGGVPPIITAKLGAPIKPHVDLDHDSGFAVVNLAPLLADVPAVPLVGGVTTTDVVRSLDGPLSIEVGVGELVIDAHVPLNDPAPAKALVEHCTDVPAVAAMGATVDGGACHIPVPQYNFSIDAWVDGKQLHFGTKGRERTATAPAPAFGNELAAGQWQLELWGHGTLLAPNLIKIPVTYALPDMVPAMLRGMVMLNEMGLGVTIEGDAVHFVGTVRTAWANPDDVLVKLQAVTAQDILTGKGSERGKAIADAAPDSPFAADYKAGTGGLMIPTAVVGILAGVAIPAFLDYMNHASGGGRRAKTMVKMMVQKYAFEAYPMWAAAHPDKACPASLGELDQYVDGIVSPDPWGNPYHMYCGAKLPAGAKGIAVVSFGPDGQEGTDDDIKSWE